MQWNKLVFFFFFLSYSRLPAVFSYQSSLASSKSFLMLLMVEHYANAIHCSSQANRQVTVKMSMLADVSARHSTEFHREPLPVGSASYIGKTICYFL